MRKHQATELITFTTPIKILADSIGIYGFYYVCPVSGMLAHYTYTQDQEQERDDDIYR